MQIKVNKDGEVIIETNGSGVDDAMELIRRLQGNAEEKKVSQVRSESMKLAAQKVDTGTGELNQIQYRTWQYLADNDCPDGIHVSQVAHAFGVNKAAANTRLLVLERMGYAQRVAKGYYRALTPENG